ncbi:MAG: type IX secretion system membrane protein PorP/SprF [Flavobacteriales bacterium]
MEKTLFIWLALALTCFELKAQDPQFSQFYANPLYLNPALAGTNGCGRLNLNFRDQWPQLAGQFITYSASYDHSVSAINGGLGLLITSDNAGQGTLITNRVGAIYSYIKNMRNFSFSFALQADIEQKILHSETLVFGNQYNAGGPLLPSTEVFNRNILYPDFSTGAVAYSKYMQVGLAVHHLLEPNQSFFMPQAESLLPRKYTAHVGVTIPTSRKMESYISPQVIYQQQRDFKELNLGLYAKKGPVTGGIWYRTRDAVILNIALQTKQFRIGYSYDVTLSKLSSASVGSHEIAVGYAFTCKQGKKLPRKMGGCPSW